MIELRDTVMIAASPAKVWAWLSDLPTHYQQWHPAHTYCRYQRGNTLEKGTVLAVEENLHGRMHRLKLRATEVVPDRLLRYSSRGFRGAFVLEETTGGTRFTATVSFGSAMPWIGRLADRVLGRLFATRLAALQQHMREEGESLKEILEREENEQTVEVP